jgi:uncharacterized protein (DUF1786 family)
MEPILTIDIGAGTTDILIYFPDRGELYKAVTLSAIKRTAQYILKEKGELLITGTIMGGGAVSKAVVQKAKTDNVYMTPEAAQTVNNDIEKVKEKGITIISEEKARHLQKDKAIKHIAFEDLSLSGIKSLLTQLGARWNFSYIAGAVQDHGVCPEGVSALDFRHQVLKERIEHSPSPEEFLFLYEEIPEYLTRMKATGKILSQIPHRKLFMMDTGMAAIVGASLDTRLLGCTHYLIVDIGNSHTLGAVLSEGLIGGFFEYHTDGLNPQKMEELLINLGDGRLNHQEIVSKGGHGAYVRFCPGFDKIEKIVVTGPRRREIMKYVSIDYIEGAPLGDNMMTGASGLLESINRKEKLNLNYYGL